jgi:hypothetical protein
MPCQPYLSAQREIVCLDDAIHKGTSSSPKTLKAVEMTVI